MQCVPQRRTKAQHYHRQPVGAIRKAGGTDRGMKEQVDEGANSDTRD